MLASLSRVIGQGENPVSMKAWGMMKSYPHAEAPPARNGNLEPVSKLDRRHDHRDQPRRLSARAGLHAAERSKKCIEKRIQPRVRINGGNLHGGVGELWCWAARMGIHLQAPRGSGTYRLFSSVRTEAGRRLSSPVLTIVGGKIVHATEKFAPHAPPPIRVLLFERRGGQPGKELDDWLEAEREVRAHFGL